MDADIETTDDPGESVANIVFLDALKFWLKLGFISFGGPAGQISIMHHELVEKNRWISENRFLHALNYTMLLPGPEAQQLATYIGWLFHGVRGGLIAGALFVLPSFFILCALAWIYLVFSEVTSVAGVLYGIKPAVTAIVLFAAYRIGTRALNGPSMWMIAILAFVAIFLFNVPFPYIVLAAALAGAAGGRLLPGQFSMRAGHGGAPGAGGPALIDDHTPVPPHARFSWRRLMVFCAVGAGIWVTVMGALAMYYGWDGSPTQMGWFFTKAALVTFGGAYAVLPYVYQGAVESYGWLTTTQMIDGLALGETTPGPLIMVVTFVGFVGGWTVAIFGAESLPAAAILGASIATLFTFLPSFLFILAGGPAVEATRGEIRFTAPLSAITAAVVGVIVNLALFFAVHVLWPSGLSGRFDWFSAMVGILALVALLRLRWGVITVIGACASIGLLHHHLLV